MKRKLLTVLLSLAAALCLCFGLAACGEGKFSISTLEKIPMGASQEKVESVLGKPSEGGEGSTQWIYYDSALQSYANRAKALEEKQEEAFLKGDAAELDKIMQDYANLLQEMANKRFSCVQVTFSADGTVTSVFLDKAYSAMEGSQGKSIQRDEVIYSGSADTIEQQYYTDYREDTNGERLYIKDTMEKDSISYATTFSDGSWYHALLHTWDGGDSWSWRWTDEYGTHSASKPSNVQFNNTSVGAIDRDGEWYNSRGIVGAFTIPDGVTSIGSSAFSDCGGMTSVTIPEGVTSIGSSAFAGCSGLTSIAIPDSVTSIGSSAFKGCSKLTSIVIPDGVTSIGSSAFEGCSGLEHITVEDGNEVYSSAGDCLIQTEAATVILGCKNSDIPDSVTRIAADAFKGCTGLKSISIPANITSIASDAFAGCAGVEHITVASGNEVYSSAGDCLIKTETDAVILGCKTSKIPASVTSIASYAFEDCIGLTAITIPGNVNEIGESAFSGCSGLKSVTLSDGVTTIGQYAFEGCSGLTGIIIPESVTSFGNAAFSDCTGLTAITIPASVTKIESSAFRGCSGLKSVTISDGVTTIGNSAFCDCKALTTVVIPGSVTSIESSAFRGCSGLNGITLPESVTSIGESVFAGCSGLTAFVIPDGVSSIRESTFSGCSGLKSVTIPDGVESILRDAFYGCTALTSIAIPQGVTSIASDAFNNCGLKRVEVAAENLAYSSQDGILYNKTRTTFIYVPQALEGTVEIPDSVIAIGDYAFRSRSGITAVTIPDSVLSIGESAFMGCTKLTGIVIPDSVLSIGESAFMGCSALKTIALPDSVVSIGSLAFEGTAYYEDRNNWDSCGVLYIGDYLIATNSDITAGTYTVKAGTKTIADGAFYNCSGLLRVVIPDSVVSMGERVFNSCNNLRSVTIGDGVTSVTAGAFSGCSGLKSVTVGSSVTSIGEGAFGSCDALTTIQYAGTTTAWNEMAKAYGWISSNADYTVICTDGTVDRYGDVTPFAG